MRGKKLDSTERRKRALSSPEERKKIFKELLKHVSQGFSLDCFGMLSLETIEEWLKSFPNEFVREKLVEAQREGKTYWENIGHKQARGECLGNSRTWYYNMSNRYGWSERQEVKQDVKGAMQVNIVNYSKQNDSTK